MPWWPGEGGRTRSASSTRIAVCSRRSWEWLLHRRCGLVTSNCWPRTMRSRRRRSTRRQHRGQRGLPFVERRPRSSAATHWWATWNDSSAELGWSPCSVPVGSARRGLAIETARRLEPRFPDGVVFCDLTAAGRSPVVTVVAGALGVERRAGHDELERLTEVTRRDRCLLVLDNCEHVLDETAALAEVLLGETEHVTMLATSRVRLAVDGEQLCVVPPLSCELAGQGGRSPAAELLVDRARAVHPGFELGDGDDRLVEGLCRRLDGLPLAIELAAARMQSLSLREITDALGPLDRGAPRGTTNRRSPPVRRRRVGVVARAPRRRRSRGAQGGGPVRRTVRSLRPGLDPADRPAGRAGAARSAGGVLARPPRSVPGSGSSTSSAASRRIAPARARSWRRGHPAMPNGCCGTPKRSLRSCEQRRIRPPSTR